MLRGKFKATNTYIGKGKNSQINNLRIHLCNRAESWGGGRKPKGRRRKERKRTNIREKSVTF